MAVSHALNTREQHVRADGSTYHLVNYDPATGAVQSKGTVQGYSAESTWSRGQAWAVYGFTMAYRETGDPRFLETARATADYFIGHLPADHVPPWDFQAPPVPTPPRDSSAAAIAAAGLLELSRLEPDAGRRQHYFATAQSILLSLSSPAYLAEGTPSQSVLLHGTRNKPSGSYDTGLIWGDYYFLEALLRATVGSLAGRVIDHRSANGIAGAVLSYADGTAITDATGAYRVERIASGPQIIRVTAPGYARAEQTLTIAAGATQTATFELVPQPAIIEGTVSERATGRPIGFASVSSTAGMTVTNAVGHYRLEQPLPGTYRVTASARGYASVSQEVVVQAGVVSTAHFELDVSQALGQSTPMVWLALITQQSTNVPLAVLHSRPKDRLGALKRRHRHRGW
jgi:hypothetical protein